MAETARPLTEPGTPGRFETVVVPEIPVLWRAALAVTNNKPHDAEDLLQDTLLRAFRFLDGFDGQHPRAWLLTILRNTNINRNRRQRPTLLTDPDTPEAGSVQATPSAEDHATLGRLDGPLEVALGRLSPKLRAVVDLVDVSGFTYDEAAATLGVPAGTIMSRLHRARRHLRSDLERHRNEEGHRP